MAITDGSITLNTGGLAFCIIFPDGNIKNVQDTQCRFFKWAVTVRSYVLVAEFETRTYQNITNYEQ